MNVIQVRMSSENVVVSLSDSENYLKLAQNKISFEGISKSQLTSVFFDEANAQVFSISSGDVTEVKVRSPIESFCNSFQIIEKGRIVSIKFSFDQTILALQRTQTAVDFLTFEDGHVSKEFTQTFKGCNLLGYLWTGKTEIVLVSNVSVKLCKVDVRSGTLSTLKNVNLSVNWYNYYSPINLLLVSLANSNNTMQLLQIKQNQIVKLMKFDIDGEYVSKTKKLIADRDIILGVVYNQPRILFLNVHTSNTEAEVIVYTIMKLSSIKRTHVLRINQGGRFALNIVDNLIIVHNQVTKSSLVFDITNAEFQGAVKYHNPVLEPRSIKPLLEEETATVSQKKVYELYNPNWVIFQPNIVMDAKAGCLWFIEIDLWGFYKYIEDKKELIGFLLLRSNSKMVIARTLETLLEDGFNTMEELGDIFDQINFVYRSYLEENMKSQMGLPSSMTQPEEDPVVEFRTVVDQYFIYSYVLCKVAEKVSENVERKESKILTMALLEYIRSLTDFQIPAQHFLYELLINSLVIQGKFYQLYQLLQYRVVADSKPLACLLLSLENVYNGASQLALDMLERLGSAREEIIEILLSKQVMPAIRYAAKHGASNDRNRISKFLEVAKETGNDKLYYSVSSHFKEN